MHTWFINHWWLIVIVVLLEIAVCLMVGRAASGKITKVDTKERKGIDS